MLLARKHYKVTPSSPNWEAIVAQIARDLRDRQTIFIGVIGLLEEILTQERRRSEAVDSKDAVATIEQILRGGTKRVKRVP